ncbi:hypothetical protein [Vibrio owensii]|uniref:hypothetical protein n=1 Tax=Vibrio harveyi group TaxID=717610 RepID=UPI003CC63F87
MISTTYNKELKKELSSPEAWIEQVSAIINLAVKYLGVFCIVSTVQVCMFSLLVIVYGDLKVIPTGEEAIHFLKSLASLVMMINSLVCLVMFWLKIPNVFSERAWDTVQQAVHTQARIYETEVLLSKHRLIDEPVVPDMLKNEI